ncbi:uncharacterized protein [Ptychodera flava]|uniref:uncharacterized protein n=1 Tax=Ptychodera flava TaxID=63121 RepID=UPI003969CFD1
MSSNDFAELDEKIDWGFVLEEVEVIADPDVEVDETRDFAESTCDSVQENCNLARPRSRHTDPAVSYRCPTCARQFKSSSGFRGHTKKVHGENFKASLYKVISDTGVGVDEGSKIQSTPTQDTNDNIVRNKFPGTQHKLSTGFTRPNARYSKNQMESELPEMMVKALENIADDPNLNVNGSIHGGAVSSIACQLVNKAKCGEMALPDNINSSLSTKLWQTLTAGDNSKTYSSHNEEVWTSFYGLWIDKDITNTLIQFFQNVLSHTVSHANLFRTIRMFLFKLVVEARRQRDSIDFASERAEDINTVTLCKEEEEALLYFVGYIPYKLRRKHISQRMPSPVPL